MAGSEVIWAHKAPVAFTHPGWPSLSGREQVMQSSAAILSTPDTRGIAIRCARAHRCGEAAFVTCYEVIGDSLLAPTNLFDLEAGRRQLVPHQPGPCNLPPPHPPPDEERPLQ